MVARKTFLSWPVFRQLTGTDPLGPRRGGAVGAHRAAHRRAPRPPTGSRAASARTARSAAARRSTSRTSKVIQIEGDPDSPISRGRLCPKGSASKQLVTSPRRQTKVRYRAPVRHRVGGPRPRHRDGHDRRPGARGPQRHAGRTSTTQGRTVRRTLGIASLGGATLDNEENYLIKKLFTALGAIQIENQARI